MTESPVAPGDRGLEATLSRAIEGEVRFDPFTRGLYSTDASHYQIEPLGVVFPRSTADVEAVLEIAREQGIPVTPRGGGTSQCGQAIGRSIVLDTNRHLTAIGTVEPATDRSLLGRLAESALEVLDAETPRRTTTRRAEIERHRGVCLAALGRNTEAAEAHARAVDLVSLPPEPPRLRQVA